MQHTDWNDLSQAGRAAYVDDDTDLGLLAGTALLHTDFIPLNVLLTAAGTWVIDWAWPTCGAAFIDPACFLLRLMLGGHTAAQAEAWAAHRPPGDRHRPRRSTSSLSGARALTTRSPAMTSTLEEAFCHGSP